MALAAKQGAKSNKWTRDPQLGDLVLARVKGYPACPAKVSRPEDWGHVPVARKFFVYFFGTKEIAFVALQDLFPFTEEVKTDLLNQAREKRLPKRNSKGFEEALVEICKVYDELQDSSKTGNGFLPDRTLDLIEKPTEHLVKPPDDGGTQKVERMEGDSSMDKLITLGHSSGTERDVKDGGHDRKDPFPMASKRKISVEKDHDHPKKKKPATSKSATDLHLEQEHSPSSSFSEREIEDQKVGKESHPPEDLILDPAVPLVCALEVPEKCKTEKQLNDADKKENKHAGVTGISMRTAPESLPIEEAAATIEEASQSHNVGESSAPKHKKAKAHTCACEGLQATLIACTERLAIAIEKTASSDNISPLDLWENMKTLPGFGLDFLAHYYAYLVENPRTAKAFQVLENDQKVVWVARYVKNTFPEFVPNVDPSDGKAEG